MSKSVTVTLEPTVLKWAREQAGLSVEDLARKFSAPPQKVESWEANGQLTFKQAEALATKTHIPLGYLYLDAPPIETLPINDFRTVSSEPIKAPSRDLLDTIDAAIIRQDWFREYSIEIGEPPLDFVGSLSGNEDIIDTANKIRATFGLEVKSQARAKDWEEAFTIHRECLERHRILVMQSGIVGENTHRKLQVEEFRGFALCDEYAPLIFINSADDKPAQMFTLMHELVHLWLGASGVSLLDKTYSLGAAVERFCNAVAAEILVPAAELKARFRSADDFAINILMRTFKVSRIVILRRLRDLNFISGSTFESFYSEAISRWRKKKDSGGHYYNTKISRLGRRFITTVLDNTLEGHTSYKEAFYLLGISNVQLMRKLAREVGIEP